MANEGSEKGLRGRSGGEWNRCRVANGEVSVHASVAGDMKKGGGAGKQKYEANKKTQGTGVRLQRGG